MSEGVVPEATHEDVERAIREALNSIESKGTFATFGHLPNFTDPQLVIDPCGPINLPLKDVDASRIIAASHQAPFGKGTQTIMDTTVRRTWELNHDQFTIQNPHFQHVVNEAICAIVGPLGIATDAERCLDAQLYKLLLYEQGALFKPHTDTEKVPGMFGTLIICLPSSHEGGQIMLSHNGETRKFATAECQPSFASWYSNVTHEIKEVTSGYRLVLTYNLVHVQRSDGAVISEVNDERHAPLRAALDRWLHRALADRKSDELVYLLEHQYSDASLALRNLKTSDIVRVRALQNLADELGFVVYLASMEREVSGSCEDHYDQYYSRRRYYGWHDDEDEDEEEGEDDGGLGGTHGLMEEFERSLKLKRVVDIDGAELATDVEVDEECIVQKSPFENRDPDDEKFEGYTGNAGASAVHWYRDTVVVLVRKDRSIDFLLSPFTTGSGHDRNVLALLKLWRGKVEADGDNMALLNELQKIYLLISTRNGNALLERLTKSWGSIPFSDEVIGVVVQTRLQLGQASSPACLVAAVHSVGGQLPLEVLRNLPDALQWTTFAELQPALDAAIARYKSVSDRLKAISALAHGDVRSLTGEFSTWANESLRTAASCATDVNEQDGAALADMAECLIDANPLENVIVPVADRNKRNTRFCLAFLERLISNMLSASTHAMQPQATKVFDHAFTVMMASFSLPPTPRSPGAYPLRTQPAESGPEKASENLVSLMGFLLDTANLVLAESKQDRAEQLLGVLAREAAMRDRKMFNKILLPFLHSIQDLAKRHMNLAVGPAVKAAYTQVLEQYVRRFVQQQPSAVENWSCNAVSCRCPDCQRLTAFLVSQQQVGRFAVNKQRRQHLHQQLDSHCRDCKHETERRGSPQTLVVTKANRSKAAQQAWLQRCSEAHVELMKFDQGLLEGLLGEQYDRTVNMRMVTIDPSRGPGFAGRQLLQARSNPPAALAGTKRKAAGADASGPSAAKRKVEVIDLRDTD